MRQYNAKIKKNLFVEYEKDLIERIVYNKKRNSQFATFEDWFDNYDKLKSSNICDCINGGMKIDWKDFGNNSVGNGYRWFLKEHENFTNHEEDGVRDSRNYLGSYTPMRSPGRIKLYVDNLQVFFWSIICELACNERYVFTKEKIEDLASLCFYKTLYHELFHHFIDAQSYLINGFRYDFCTEEALAVACSRQLVGFETKFNQTYVSDFLKLAYEYSSPGYREWINYKSDEQFLLKLIDYMPLSINLASKGQQLTPICEGILYSIIENPNIEIEVI